MIKLHIHYSYTEQPTSQFPPEKCAKNTRDKVTLQAKIQVNDLNFYLKLYSPIDDSTNPAIKIQSPGFPTNGALDWVKMS